MQDRHTHAHRFVFSTQTHLHSQFAFRTHTQTHKEKVSDQETYAIKKTKSKIHIPTAKPDVLASFMRLSMLTSYAHS